MTKTRHIHLPATAAKLAAVAAFAIATLVTAHADAEPLHVAVLGPSDAPILARLQRNVAAMKLDGLYATVTVCTRDVITRLVNELHADAAICTDGDQIGVWTRADDRLVLKEAVVVQSADERAHELAAARAVMILQPAQAKAIKSEPLATPTSFTITANGPRSTSGSDSTAPPMASPPGKDAPATPVPKTPPERITPRLVLGIGPALAASRDGNSFALSAEAAIGVSRYVALVPWIQFVPANRLAEASSGSASFRPTIFGLGFALPIFAPSSFIVPRLGAGYGVLWMHVTPESAVAPATMRDPEDLLAPIMYGTFALSMKVAQSFRIAGEGMVGVSTHDMVVRIGNEKAAHWGVPVASAALRGEWVMQ
jgi:hypothetical protein